MTREEFDKLVSEASLAHEDHKGADCLNSRVQPGVKVAECIHVFCGCDLHESYTAGANFAREIYENKLAAYETVMKGLLE